MEYKRIERFMGAVVYAGILISCSHAPRTEVYADGLQRSFPEAQETASEGILSFLEAVETNGIELHSFMLLRHGKVISEAWWHPYKATTRQVMHSVSKTFTATAIGFAVDEKLLATDDKVISFFPDALPDTVSPFLQEMRIRDLLTMAAGFERTIEFTIDNPNWVKAFLAIPVVEQPGGRFVYNSYATYMLSAIIQKVTGMTVQDYLTPRLLEPLGITDVQWEKDGNGIIVGGWGMRIKTSDMAKLGQFYLNRGKWNGEQLLSEAWIAEASSPHIFQQPERTAEENAGDFFAQGYGYQVWMCPDGAYRADGANAQLVVVLPAKDAVIVTTSHTSQAGKLMELMWTHLLPRMYDKPISDDANGRAELSGKLSSLQLPSPFASSQDTTYPRNTTRAYQLEPNGQGFRSASFRFDKNGDCLLTLAGETASCDLSFGQERWNNGETEKAGAYYLVKRRNPAGMAPFAVSGFSAWTQPEQLSLRLLYLNDSQHETYVCDFKGDRITITCTNNVTGDVVVLRGSSDHSDYLTALTTLSVLTIGLLDD
ncbi:putative periplasmic esterase [Bacteroidales bacterium Barb7]|nr:putative periplasmic esterase [Bacteroidales bacterium Barb7]